ncbi:MAG TPA: sulfite oxidase [Anaerolineae bacterium]|nr:sulfite oxidase [Anaerolineae bacterium]
MSELDPRVEQEVESLWHRVQRTGMRRREFLTLLAAGGAAAVLVACGAEDEAEPTLAPTEEVMAPTEAPAPTEEPTAEAGNGDEEAEAAAPFAKPVLAPFFIVHGTNAETRMRPEVTEDYLTDSGLFFVRTHEAPPILDPAEWRLRIFGNAVENEIELTFEDLLAMPAQTVTRFIECAGNGRGLYDILLDNPGSGTQWITGAYGVGSWTGVRLADILERAGVMQSAVSVMGTGLDVTQVAKPMSIEKAMADDTLVVYALNGAPLPYDHGFPARLLVPGYVGIFNVKWLGSLEVADEQLYSRWNTTSYILAGPEYSDPEGPPEGEPFNEQTVKSAIALPWPATLSAGEQTITGFAWSPYAEIETVEVSLDGGQSWDTAELFGENIAAAGTRWRYTFSAQPGEMTITTRATDAAGNTQWPVEEQVWNEQGYIWGAVIPHPVMVSG